MKKAVSKATAEYQIIQVSEHPKLKSNNKYQVSYSMF